MPIPTGSAAISFSQIRNEANNGSGGAFPSASTPTAPQGTAMSLNNATFRSRLTDTAQNNPISLSAIRGNAYQRFTIAANTTNYNIYDVMASPAIGWTKTSKGSADVVINNNVVVGSPSTGTYAMDTGGSYSPATGTGWPGPSTIVVLNNGGYIVGMGGAGGNGGPAGGNGAAGSAGGPGLRAQRSMTLTNTGIVGGGGGGGGGGDGKSYSAPVFTPSPVPFNLGGGGGGGGRTGNSPSAGGGPGPASGNNPDPGNAGQVGTFASFGNGGNAGTGGPQGGTPGAGPGGPGGGWGVAGTVGGRSGGNGGAAGVAVQGWTSFVTAPTGTTGISGPTAG